MIGGALAIWGALGLGPAFFVQRLYDYVPTVNLFVGMIRTPVFAVTIAIVGCRLGMTVKDDVISLGRQVTTAVVQSIFLIFMIDAVFAVLFNGFVF
jgi:phospholipid/cholesterol/gamma-HCH transport system permease protein